MRLFKPAYKSKTTGKTKRVSKWWVEFRDHAGKVRRVAGFTDRRQTESLGRTIGNLVTYRITGSPMDPSMRQWVDSMAPKLRNALLDIGLLDSRAAAAGTPLLDHVEGEKDAEGRIVRPGFRQFLEAKANSARHVDNTVDRVRRIVDDCGFATWPQISASALLDYLHRRRRPGKEGDRRMSAASYNHYLKAFKQFCKWMCRDKRASDSPVAYLETINAKTDPVHQRRALSVEEATWLLKTTAAEPERWNMTGRERAMLYFLGIETGLRANELGTLTPRRCELGVTDPAVYVTAGYAKAKHERHAPLRQAAAATLAAFVKDRTPDTPLFRLPRCGSKADKQSYRTAAMLRDDLEAARAAWLQSIKGTKQRADAERSDFLRYRNGVGEYVDFHAIRHTRAVWLFEHNKAHPREVMDLLGVGSMSLVERYSRSFRLTNNDVVERGPSLPDPMANESQPDVKKSLA